MLLSIQIQIQIHVHYVLNDAGLFVNKYKISEIQIQIPQVLQDA